MQKVGEAEIMAQTGITNILLTYNVLGQAKAERLAHLTYFAAVGVAIDNEKALESVCWAASRVFSGRTIPRTRPLVAVRKPRRLTLIATLMPYPLEP